MMTNFGFWLKSIAVQHLIASIKFVKETESFIFMAVHSHSELGLVD